MAYKSVTVKVEKNNEIMQYYTSGIVGIQCYSMKHTVYHLANILVVDLILSNVHPFFP